MSLSFERVVKIIVVATTVVAAVNVSYVLSFSLSFTFFMGVAQRLVIGM